MTSTLDRRTFLAAGAAAALTPQLAGAQGAMKLKSIYPTRSGSSWTMWIAKEAGLYEKYGLDVTPEFGVHPVGIAGLISGEVTFSNYSLDDVAAAAARDPVLVSIGGLLRRGSFALMARPEFKAVEDLKGKRMGVGRVGDPPYHYTVGLFKEYGMKPTDVQWVPTGTDAAARVTMLITGQIDAALVTPPAWYRLEAQGLKPLTLMEEHEKIVLTVGNTFKKSWVAANRRSGKDPAGTSRGDQAVLQRQGAGRGGVPQIRQGGERGGRFACLRQRRAAEHHRSHPADAESVGGGGGRAHRQ